jgi:CRISPR/Cas system-associated endoribonuclease Cas2
MCNYCATCKQLEKLTRKLKKFQLSSFRKMKFFQLQQKIWDTFYVIGPSENNKGRHGIFLLERTVNASPLNAILNHPE